MTVVVSRISLKITSNYIKGGKWEIITIIYQCGMPENDQKQKKENKKRKN